MLDYNPTSFSQGRMDFAWEELSEEERAQAHADWEAGRGLIGGDPRLRPGSDALPAWGLNRAYFRTLALDDARGDNGPRLRAALASAAPLEIEIGYGRGDFLLDRTARFPQSLFVGYETKIKATRLCLDRVERFGLGNVWLSDDDARFSLPRLFADGRAEIVHLLFPDPWWKTTYKARRLISPPFVDLLARLLRPGGLFHFKSDVEEYAELVAYLVEQHPAFAPHDPALLARIGDHAPTHREDWCVRHGKPVYTRVFGRRK
jgi:tRNA (guanine-N7-)-methyltransferase